MNPYRLTVHSSSPFHIAIRYITSAVKMTSLNNQSELCRQCHDVSSKRWRRSPTWTTTRNQLCARCGGLHCLTRNIHQLCVSCLVCNSWAGFCDHAYETRIQQQRQFVMTSRTTYCSRKSMFCTTSYYYYYYYIVLGGWRSSPAKKWDKQNRHKITLAVVSIWYETRSATKGKGQCV